MSRLVYLATPYSHPDKSVKEQRYVEACKQAARLMEKGLLVFCPIAHSHPIETLGMPDIKSGDWWLRQDFAILQHCDELIVYRMDGWDKSYGVGKEIAYARDNMVPISFLDPEEETV